MDTIQKLSHKNDVLFSLLELDEKIWSTYHDNCEFEYVPDLEEAPTIITNTIQEILLNFPHAEDDVLLTIQNSAYGDEILQNYVNMDKIRENVKIRSNFAQALSSVEKGSELSPKLNWTLSSNDLCELAKLHTRGQYKEKIEELLITCKLFEEYDKFIIHEYDDILAIAINDNEKEYDF